MPMSRRFLRQRYGFYFNFGPDATSPPPIFDFSLEIKSASGSRLVPRPEVGVSVRVAVIVNILDRYWGLTTRHLSRQPDTPVIHFHRLHRTKNEDKIHIIFLPAAASSIETERFFDDILRKGPSW